MAGYLETVGGEGIEELADAVVGIVFFKGKFRVGPDLRRSVHISGRLYIAGHTFWLISAS